MPVSMPYPELAKLAWEAQQRANDCAAAALDRHRAGLPVDAACYANAARANQQDATALFWLLDAAGTQS